MAVGLICLLLIAVGAVIYRWRPRMHEPNTEPQTIPKSQISLSVFGPQYGSHRKVQINGAVSTSQGKILRIVWDWGDGTSNSSWFPSAHSYRNDGEYQVQVIAICDDGQQAIAQTIVKLSSFVVQPTDAEIAKSIQVKPGGPGGSVILLAEDFQKGTLDPRLKIQTTGLFDSPPGIKNVTSFGRTRAFGFGRSTCAANCFSSYASRLVITFPIPTFIETISFKEMELFGNWGSGGHTYVDGARLPSAEFGRLPYNDRRADTTYRNHVVSVGALATTIEFRVTDITSASEIYIDDLVVTARKGQHVRY